MIHLLRILEIAGVASLISATVIAYLYVKQQAAAKKRQLASKFQQSRAQADNPSRAAVDALATLYGTPRRKS